MPSLASTLVLVWGCGGRSDLLGSSSDESVVITTASGGARTHQTPWGIGGTNLNSGVGDELAAGGSTSTMGGFGSGGVGLSGENSDGVGFGGEGVGGSAIDDGDPDENDACSDGMLRLIEGDVEVHTQAALDALTGVTEIMGKLLIVGETPLSITSVDALACLRRVAGDLDIYANHTLESVDGFASLNSAGRLLLVGNPGLRNLHGFKSLTTLAGDLHIGSNSGLADVQGFTSLKTVGGYLSIFSNAQIMNLDGFTALISVGGYFNIVTNDALESVSGFPVLESVGGDMSVRGNASLKSWSGLAALKSVGNGLYISDNPLLTELHGLHSIENLQGDFEVTDNFSLPTCEAERLRDVIEVVNITANIEISGNNDAGICL